MAISSSLPLNAKNLLWPTLVYGCVCALLINPSDAWAGPKPRSSQPSRSFWSRVAFTDESQDFIPPPPREEVIDHNGASSYQYVQSAEPLFDGEQPVGSSMVQSSPGGPQGSLEADGGNVVPMPVQREYYDPGFNNPHSPLTWQLMPSGLMYRSYLAGEKEPRIANVWNKDAAGRDVMESTLGARVGLLRYGTVGAYRPQGWQFDLEGAALTRVLPGTDSTELEAVDYRVGLLSTWSEGPWHVKAGYYHLSSHLGDEFVLADPLYPRLNYVRDSLITGVTYELTDDWQTYGEIAYALGKEDGAEPIELQYGIQYSPMAFGFRGAPFAALNGHTRQDFGYITSITFQAGWQWRGSESQRLFRVGMQYYDGPALQWSFAGRNETLIGGGMWFDF